MVDAYTGTDTQTGRDKPALRAILRARRRALNASQQHTAASLLFCSVRLVWDRERHRANINCFDHVVHDALVTETQADYLQ